MEKFDTVVIGGGPAGLATAASLKRRGVNSVVLEKGETVAPAWHRHYERLHLHTNKTVSGLPGREMPESYPRYPSRDQVAEYLTSYARDEGVDVRLGVEVTSCFRSDGVWKVLTAADETYVAQSLVVATGLSHIPSIPGYPGLSGFGGEVMHSADYRNGAPFEGKRALVVGFGNSAGEIALDLAEHGAESHISVRSPSVVVPRDILGIPILTISRWLSVLPPRLADFLSKPLLWLMVGDVSRYGIPKSGMGPLEQMATTGKVPLLDVGTLAALKEGLITAHPGIVRFTSTGVEFVDGTGVEVDVVVFGTGYRVELDVLLGEISELVDKRGVPLVSGGPTMIPGLYFCGFREPPTGRLREIGLEAERIAELIAGRRQPVG